MTFAVTLARMRQMAKKSRYRLAQYSGIDQAYVMRLENGDKANPSRDVVLMLAFSLMEGSKDMGLHHVDELLLAAGYAPLRKRDDQLPPAA